MLNLIQYQITVRRFKNNKDKTQGTYRYLY